MKRSKSVKVGIIVAILLISVGFAAVSTTLNINGSTSVKSNADDFSTKVVFSDEDGKKPTLVASDTTKQASITAPTLSADKRTITFTTPALNTLGEKVTLSYNVKNDSQYNVKLGDTTCNIEYAGEGAAPESAYVTVKATNGFKDIVVNKGDTTSTTDTVVLEMVRSYIGDAEISYNVTCTLSATAEEAQ